MEKKINSLNFDKAFARKSPAEFAKFKGPFFVDSIYEVIEDENGNKVRTDKVTNRFVRKLVGPMNENGTVPPESQGDTLAYVATSWDPAGEHEFAAFRDDDGALQWILQNKTAGFTKETVFFQL